MCTCNVRIVVLILVHAVVHAGDNGKAVATDTHSTANATVTDMAKFKGEWDLFGSPLCDLLFEIQSTYFILYFHFLRRPRPQR